MRIPVRLTLVSLVVVAVASASAATAGAVPARSAACTLQGTWTASTASVNTYMARLLPTYTIRVTAGRLVMSFTPSRWRFRSVGVRITGQRGRIVMRSGIVIDSQAAYTATATAVTLRGGSYSNEFVDASMEVSGRTVPLPLPAQRGSSPGSQSLPYRCTPTSLTITVQAPSGPVPITLRRV